MPPRPLISVIAPLYNEEAVLEAFYARVKGTLEGIDYELVLVNDGSRDRTLSIAKDLCRRDPRVKLISLSRNFGHQIAITAGLDKASGEAVVIIDADLQDPPEVIPEMIERWREGCKVVYGVRTKRQGESLFKRLSAAMFYRLMRRLTSVDIPLDAGDFRLLDRAVVEQLASMRERHRFLRGLTSWVGFKQCEVHYTRDPRFAGETKYPLKKMLGFALDAIFSFSNVPLRMASLMGFAVSGVSFLLILYGLGIRLFAPESAIPGWASVFVAILFLGGVQLIAVGILGEYIARIYEEVKQRPLYVIDEEVNC